MPQIHYRRDGNGPAVVLLHGWAASHHDWDNIFPSLVKSGYRVYALDQLAHGQSEKPGDACTCHLEQIYTAFCEWMQNLALAHPFALVGHSMGGYIGLRYAIENPARLLALGLLDPLYAPQQLTFLARQISRRPALLEKLLRYIPGQILHPLEAIIPPTARNTLQGYYQASPYIAYTLADIPSLEDRLHRISLPIMLLYGGADISLQPSSFRKLQQQLPQIADFLCIPGAGHYPHLTHAGLVTGHLIGFLDRFVKNAAVSG